jgi:hypothetical protein
MVVVDLIGILAHQHESAKRFISQTARSAR